MGFGKRMVFPFQIHTYIYSHIHIDTHTYALTYIFICVMDIFGKAWALPFSNNHIYGKCLQSQQSKWSVLLVLKWFANCAELPHTFINLFIINIKMVHKLFTNIFIHSLTVQDIHYKDSDYHRSVWPSAILIQHNFSPLHQSWPVQDDYDNMGLN